MFTGYGVCKLTRENSCSWYGYHSLFCKFVGNIRLLLALPGLAEATGCRDGGVFPEPKGIQEVHRPGRSSCYCFMAL